MQGFLHYCLHLSGKNGESYRSVLGLDLLPVVHPLPETLDCGEYGRLVVLHIDAARLSGPQKERLIDWIWRDGDNPNRDEVRNAVKRNMATYRVEPDENYQLILHDPVAWG